ncbi:MAG TPA: hypothetical protein VK137_14675, partial [Planctomycetaceae bacterium]|nr:hypothetical protein [Planctomycetaceae bacterium]
DPIPDLTALRPDIPPEVNALFQRLMAKSRSDRPSSALEIVREIDAIVKSGARGPRASPSKTTSPPTPATNHTPAACATAEHAQTLSDLFDAIQADQRTVTLAPTLATVAARGPRANRRWLIALAAVASLILAGIIIVIKHKDGTTTKIKVPDGAQVEISSTDRGEPVAVRPRRASKTTDVRGLTPPGSPNTKSKIANQKSNIENQKSLDPDRAAAECVLAQKTAESVWLGIQVTDQPGAVKKLHCGQPLPDEPFHVVEIAVHGGYVTDFEVAKYMPRLARLTYLSFNICTRITDASMPTLREIVSLNFLNVGGTSLSPPACMELLQQTLLLEKSAFPVGNSRRS